MLLPIVSHAPVLLLQITTQQHAEPFFTNDLAGLLKVIGTFGSMLVVFLTALFKLVFHKTNADVVDIRKDVDGVGKRIDDVERQQLGCSTEVSALTARLAVHEGTVSNVQREQGSLGSSVEAMRKQSTELQRDIMSAIIEGNRQVNESIAGIRVEVARLDERGQLSHSLSQIADSMRERERERERERARRDNPDRD
jgi:predicted  nucleic acid-binding Zn-ribbon protein